MSPPEMRRPAKAATLARAKSAILEVQQEENATAGRQAQHLMRAFALSASAAVTVAELAFAGGPR